MRIGRASQTHPTHRGPLISLRAQLPTRQTTFSPAEEAEAPQMSGGTGFNTKRPN